MSPLNEFDMEVMRAAYQWWESRRPLGWGLGQHCANPTVNLHYASEKELAEALADRVKFKLPRPKGWLEPELPFND